MHPLPSPAWGGLKILEKSLLGVVRNFILVGGSYIVELGEGGGGSRNFEVKIKIA